MPYITQRGLPLCNKSGVYVITNKKNGKVYVGSATCIRGRLMMHRSELRRGVHHSQPLQSSWDKHGEKAFKFSVLETCKPGECAVKEQYWIDKLEAHVSTGHGYNVCPYAFSLKGRKHSKQSRQRMSEQRKGIVPVEATKAAAEANRGRKRPEYIRKKISESHQGKKFTDEHRANIKRTHWSKRLSPEEVSRIMKETGAKGGRNRPGGILHANARVHRRLKQTRVAGSNNSQ